MIIFVTVGCRVWDDLPNTTYYCPKKYIRKSQKFHPNVPKITSERPKHDIKMFIK